MKKTDSSTTSGSTKKKPSTVKTGNLYKAKTREWFRKRGYACEYTEVLQGIYIPGRGMYYRKFDLFGSDGIAMNGKEIIFWNSKATIGDEVAKSKLQHGIDEFNKFPFPKFVKRQLIAWTPKVKEPKVIKIKHKEWMES